MRLAGSRRVSAKALEQVAVAHSRAAEEDNPPPTGTLEMMNASNPGTGDPAWLEPVDHAADR
jgi:hypothetical protein